MNPVSPVKYRIPSIDIVRGIIMVIMTLDHCRDFLHFQGPEYNPTNMATTTGILFFTRWITHFCAPVFVFLSGVSAYLAGQRRSKGELAAFLIKRGLWLIIADMTIMTLLFSFNPKFNGIMLEVLWAIGGSMILLGLLSRLPLRVIGAVGVVIFFGHNLLDSVQLPQGTGAAIFNLLFNGTVLVINKDHLILGAYPLLPWTGAMLLGYVYGSIYKSGFNSIHRKRILLLTGILLTLLFIGLRLVNLYGDPAPWAIQKDGVHTVLSFFNTTKRPPSLIYLCMTLGPALILLSLMDNAQGKLAGFFKVYGNVPFFYFIVHFTFIRIINVILVMTSGIDLSTMKSPGAPFVWGPVPFGYPLWVIYLIWVFVFSALYFPCRWFANYKQTHKQWWLSYL